MKNTASFLLLFVVCSCSNSDGNSTKPPFFNLKTGNLWIYKKYTAADGVHFVYDNEIDSVRVIGDSLVNGYIFSKISHKETNGEQYLDLLRVDNNGHLINESGFVKHPGYDATYQYVQTIFSGTISYHLLGSQNVTVENQYYNVSPYIGDFVSQLPEFANHQLKYWYEPNNGLVLKFKSYYPKGADIEYRLVSSDLN